MLCASELKNYDPLQVYPLKLKFVSHKKCQVLFPILYSKIKSSLRKEAQ